MKEKHVNCPIEYDAQSATCLECQCFANYDTCKHGEKDYNDAIANEIAFEKDFLNNPIKYHKRMFNKRED